jgi:hypothetical protein
MIAATPANRVFLFEGAMDMRKGFEGLSAMVSDNRIRPANHTCPKAGSREPGADQMEPISRTKSGAL